MTTIGERVTETKTWIRKTVLCDFCKHNTARNDYWDGSEAQCCVRSGDIYPESDDRILRSIDVCSDCFISKIIPAIEKLGVKFRELNVDNYNYVDEIKK